MEQNFGGLQFNQNHGRDLQASEVARGQKIVIFAVLLNILAVGVIIAAPAYGVSPELGGTLLLGSWGVRILAFILGIFGVLKIGGGLDWSGISKVLIFIALLIPLINILTLLVVNGKATAFLKAAGYKVGLAGAYKPAA
ncbi:hypothetical protein [Pseudoxanthomonas indica]|uniref:Uncharacterized protein n=1 Tax=Pseudoxanthomonas indica TaxID=428993 RepID=A0A1T5J3A7_9GAMM|nr:hypothetical protein [Pseudoxanthomonas indica]GGD56113.1 hypothetical protein GCM10007235_30670 [Pseudoxanthomonas indica]SKC45900.1 hypothetical protein SAMN06296058_0491 [Pseudoxanthomonas indica]